MAVGRGLKLLAGWEVCTIHYSDLKSTCPFGGPLLFQFLTPRIPGYKRMKSSLLQIRNWKSRKKKGPHHRLLMYHFSLPSALLNKTTKVSLALCSACNRVQAPSLPGLPTTPSTSSEDQGTPEETYNGSTV